MTINALPVVPGYYPDPSICRVGDTYWLVNSSFEAFPGLPVHRSTDLVHWEQVGHVFERPSTLPLTDAPSSGTFAPSIRHHDGTFYVIVTNMGAGAPNQIITRTTDPAAGWSAPVTVPDTMGIDPDLLWDEDGVCHLTWRGFGFSNGQFTGGISHVTINPDTGERTGEQSALWTGSGGRDAEGPHLYRRRGWWYLQLAEGGTGLGHMVTMARARSLEGPWEEHPTNPYLTHRSTDHPVQATGHADLVPLDSSAEQPDGDWEGDRFAMVHLGIRPRDPFPQVHVNGRETFLQGVDWSGDWPVVVEEQYADAIAAREAEESRSFTEALTGEPGPVAPGDEPWSLSDRWISPGGLARAGLVRDAEGRLTLSAPQDDGAARPLLAVRCRDDAWRAEAALAPQGEGAVGELCLYLDPSHWAAVRWDGSTAVGHLRIGPLEQDLGALDAAGLADASGALRLVVACERPDPRTMFGRHVDEIVLGVREGGAEDAPVREIARFDGRHLSTEVAGGFTGRLVGPRAVAGTTRVDGVSYEVG